jgi:hypothetical protein
MAHWGWGVTDTLPDALIIFEPVNSKSSLGPVDKRDSETA